MDRKFNCTYFVLRKKQWILGNVHWKGLLVLLVIWFWNTLHYTWQATLPRCTWNAGWIFHMYQLPVCIYYCRSSTLLEEPPSSNSLSADWSFLKMMECAEIPMEEEDSEGDTWLVLDVFWILFMTVSEKYQHYFYVILLPLSWLSYQCLTMSNTLCCQSSPVTTCGIYISKWFLVILTSQIYVGLHTLFFSSMHCVCIWQYVEDLSYFMLYCTNIYFLIMMIYGRLLMYFLNDILSLLKHLSNWARSSIIETTALSRTLASTCRV